MSDNLIDLPAELSPNTLLAQEIVTLIFQNSPDVAAGAVNVAEVALLLNSALATAGGSASNFGEFWGIVFSIVSSNTENEPDFRAAFEEKWNLGR